MNGTDSAVLRAEGVAKHYGHVQALRGVDLEIRAGEVVGLVGDNGAGKSTLVGVLSGAISPTEGRMEFGGAEVSFNNPAHARSLGIETVYQDLALALEIPIWANLFLGREKRKRGIWGMFGGLDRRAMIAEAEQELLATRIRIGSVKARTSALSGGQRQAIAVARAVSQGSRLVLMDEPTAALGVEQQHRVGELVRSVAERGVPVMLISHNLPQVRELCDRVLVMYRGRIVADLDPRVESVETIISWITGAAVEDRA
ncbi:ATP-binding cassette domain-containing protein [Microbacterium sp. KUDC0406]|uniref:ATP-binding cassette domain-containing protein n=1 Tax=Microbacterium sp. KUDC0406 TaxID=2909588 RepID=UPI001F3BE0D5|nr:ATP-binding cassette domain-containing protein [Microbacterium sp. KUDC0406]UJP09964.1 ATP-binding cassette domain-containing protein [Microbacterium sp. KUDC0406]